MPATSGTYNFQSIQIELLIREAFERIGILGEFTEPQKLDSARRSINFLLLSWMDKTINLWTLQGTYLPLVTGQRQYTLPNTVSNVIQANLRTSTRQLNGTANASLNPLDAPNAFDGDPTTFCNAGENGNISYDYRLGHTQYITFVGITTENDATFSIQVEYSQDDINWSEDNPLLVITQDFLAGVNVWFDIPTPIAARAYRLREVTANNPPQFVVQEIYFNNNTLDFAISDVSKYEYNTYPNKYLQSRPSVYYLDRQPFAPILNLWPTPSSQYNCLFYSYKKMMQDAGLYTNTIEIPSRFYPALVWGLSWHLALKYKPDIAQMMQAEYDKSFNLATIEDSEGTNISIRGED